MAAGGIPAVVAAMAAHLADVNLQHNACGTLWQLAKAEEGRAAIVAAGAISAVVAAMKAHGEESGGEVRSLHRSGEVS